MSWRRSCAICSVVRVLVTKAEPLTYKHRAQHSRGSGIWAVDGAGGGVIVVVDEGAGSVTGIHALLEGSARDGCECGVCSTVVNNGHVPAHHIQTHSKKLGEMYPWFIV